MKSMHYVQSILQSSPHAAAATQLNLIFLGGEAMDC